MLLNRDTFLLQDEKGISICGVYIPTRDAVHVGLYWNWDGEKKIVDFNAGDDIRVNEADIPMFRRFFFNKLRDFPDALIDSLTALAELVAANKINGFILQKEAPFYNGGKFEVTTGNFLDSSGAEKFINCGVFVVALLRTYDYHLLDWDTWPNAPAGLRIYLEDWLNSNSEPLTDRDPYYNQVKEVRGKHILICPNTETKPSPYDQSESLANDLINFLRVEGV